MDRVEQYYDTDPQIEWQRLDRHRTEYAVTLLAMKDYLPKPPAKVIDIGGGPGRYAIELSKQNYQLSLVDLSQQNLNFARNKAIEAGTSIHELVHANAVDLNAFPDSSFDAALLMGPLYHLTTPDQRRKAIEEAWRVLKSGGVLFSAFISRYAVFRDGAARYPLSLFERNKEHAEIWQLGVNTGPGFTSAYFAMPDEIIPLMESEGFSTLAMLNVEGIVADHETEINQLTGEPWEYWVKLNYQFASDPMLRGAADHLLHIGRKIHS